jgi:hypothetical protein
MSSEHPNGYKRNGPLTKGCRHNAYQEADKLIDYLQRTPNFQGAAICMTWGRGLVSTVTIGDLKGVKASFCESIKQHENHPLETYQSNDGKSDD